MSTQSDVRPSGPGCPSISQLFLPVKSQFKATTVTFLLPALNASFQLHHKNFGDGWYHVGVASHNDSQSAHGRLLIGGAAAPISGPSAVLFTEHGGGEGGAVRYLVEEVTSSHRRPMCSVDFLCQAREWNTGSKNKCDFKIRVAMNNEYTWLPQSCVSDDLTWVMKRY